MARRFWPDREALGRDFRLRFDGEPYRAARVNLGYEVDRIAFVAVAGVIGVVADYKVVHARVKVPWIESHDEIGVALVEAEHAGVSQASGSV
jgi:hypothetical protein